VGVFLGGGGVWELVLGGVGCGVCVGGGGGGGGGGGLRGLVFFCWGGGVGGGGGWGVGGGVGWGFFAGLGGSGGCVGGVVWRRRGGDGSWAGGGCVFVGGCLVLGGGGVGGVCVCSGGEDAWGGVRSGCDFCRGFAGFPLGWVGGVLLWGGRVAWVGRGGVRAGRFVVVGSWPGLAIAA